MSLTIWVIIILFILMLSISYFYFFGDLSGSHYANYISTLALIGTLVVAISFIYQYKQANDTARSDKIREYTRELQAYWIDLEKIFMDKYPYLSRLYQQINQNNLPLQTLTSDTFAENQINKIKFFEIHMCSIMFQIIENVYLENFQEPNDFNDPINIAWINKWKSWFKSNIVREQWSQKKNFFSVNTQKFIDGYIL